MTEMTSMSSEPRPAEEQTQASESPVKETSVATENAAEQVQASQDLAAAEPAKTAVTDDQAATKTESKDSGNLKSSRSRPARKQSGDGGKKRQRQRKPKRGARPETDKSEKLDEKTNELVIGSRVKAPTYVYIVNNLLNLNKYEELVLHSVNPNGINNLLKIISMLQNWGYVSVVKIESRYDPTGL